MRETRKETDDVSNPSADSHGQSAETTTSEMNGSRAFSYSWIKEVSRYQWLVLMVAWLGWIFDSMDGTLYALVQKPSMTELMGPGASEAEIGFFSSVVFSTMLIGWALGGNPS